MGNAIMHLSKHDFQMAECNYTGGNECFPVQAIFSDACEPVRRDIPDTIRYDPYTSRCAEHRNSMYGMIYSGGHSVGIPSSIIYQL